VVEGDPVAGFSLSYQLELADLAEMVALNRAYRQRRAVCGYVALGCVVAAVIWTALVFGPGRNWAMQRSPDGGIIFAIVEAVLGGAAAWQAGIWWLLGPEEVAMRIWQTRPGIRGLHRDEVQAEGVTGVDSDGVRVFLPWSAFASVRETDRALYLLGHNGEARIGLPKRGLPDSVPVATLAEFVQTSIHDRGAFAAPGDVNSPRS
jgi:hypothetical protein